MLLLIGLAAGFVMSEIRQRGGSEPPDASEAHAEAESTEGSEAEDAGGVIRMETMGTAAETEPPETTAAEEVPEVPVPLPARFDLRERGMTVSVPDQGEIGTCWAFAAAKAIETSMDEAIRQPLSADHISLQNSFGRAQDAGGNYMFASSYVLAWQGPVSEVDDPYGDGVSPEGLEPVCHIQEVQILDGRDIEAVKRMVYENGGVQSACYIPQSIEDGLLEYYRPETDSYYYPGEESPNHDMVIIGWDDAYARENFKIVPERDGAFLCMNTWGEEFGDQGYFYVSYADTQIGYTSFAYTRIEAADNYDHIYQTDLCGWTGQMGYEGPDAYLANVYEAETDVTLAAAGFYATAADTEYRIYVAEVGKALTGGANRSDNETWGGAVLDAERMDAAAPGLPASIGNDETARGGDTSESGRMTLREKAVDVLEQIGVLEEPPLFRNRVLVAEGKVSNPGFYTVDWQQDTPVAAGERFGVIVEIHSPGSGGPVAIEYRANERSQNVDISDGEGYISHDGETWTRTEAELQCNVCLKVYANDRDTE